MNLTKTRNEIKGFYAELEAYTENLKTEGLDFDIEAFTKRFPDEDCFLAFCVTYVVQNLDHAFEDFQKEKEN